MKKIFLLILSCIVMFLLGNNVSANDNYYIDSCGYYIEKDETDYINNNPTQEFYIGDNYQSSYITNDYIYLSYIEYNQEPLLMNNNSNSNGVLKRINHKNGNIIKKDGNYINDFNNNIYNILFIEDGFIYYQNEGSIYRISEECGDINLKGKEIYKLEILSSYFFGNIYKEKYLFSDGKYIYFEVENNIYRFDYINIGNLELVENVDTSIANNILFNSEILYYLNHIYYNSNGKLYKQYIKNGTILEPEEIYNEELKLFNINEDYIFFLEQDAGIEGYITKYIKNDGLDREKKLFYEGYLESGIMLEAGFIFYEILDEGLNDEVHYISFDKPLESTKILDDYYDIYYSDKDKILYNENGYVKTKLLNQKNIPTPTNLKQYIKSPLLEKEEIELGSSIGKFQSGSGIILEASIQNDTTTKYNMVFEVYRQGETTPLYTDSIELISGTGTTIVPYPGEGSYIWKAKITDNNGNESEVVDYVTNQTWEIDFSLFEGFEPYPYGFNFNNGEPTEGLLNGGINYLSLGEDISSKYIRKIEHGRLWELFYKTFDTSDFENDDRKLMDAFESMGLINGKIFKGGNCYGLAYLSVLNIYKPGYLEQNFPDFFKKIKNGNLYNSIEVPSTFGNENWDMYNDTLKTILTLYLTQNSSQHKRILFESELTPNELLSKLSNPDNKNKQYILNIYGEDRNGNTQGHAVFPYRVDGNKIYIVDNNIAYPNRNIRNIGIKESYEQYIEINGTGNGSWYSQLYSELGWTKFTDLSLMDIDDLYNGGNKSKPFGFDINDALYTLSGSSDIILTDSIGRKSGYLNGEIYKEIPGVLVDIPLDIDLSGNSSENTFKQIYLPQKLENLTIEVNAKVDESYDLMIAGGDYYTKLEGITTASGQTDTFNISRENIKIDFDDNKAENNSYNILVDDFQNNGTGSVYIDTMKINTNPQKYNIDWLEVIKNTNNAVNYQIDTNNDNTYDETINVSSIVSGDDLIINERDQDRYIFPNQTIPYNSGQSTAISSYHTIVGNYEGFNWGEDIAFTTGGEGNPRIQTIEGNRGTSGYFRGGLNILMDVPPRGETYKGYVYISGVTLEFSVTKEDLPPLEVGSLNFGTKIVNYGGEVYSNRVSFPFVPEETEFELIGEGNPTVQTSNGTRSNDGTVRYGTNIKATIPPIGETRIIEFKINGESGFFTIIRE